MRVATAAAAIGVANAAFEYSMNYAKEREAFGVVALKSGNLAMQRYNTGIGGYKTVNQAMLLNRMAPWLLERYGGGSKLVAH